MHLSLFRRTLNHFKLPILLSFSWIAVFVVIKGFNGYLEVIAEHYPIAITMLFGSMVAGGTPLGGGAVAFPVMTKLLGYSPEFAKQFSLAIQTVGMGTASFFILHKQIPVYKPVLIHTMPAACLGVLSSLILFSDVFPLVVLKVLFSSFLLFVFVVLIKLEYQPQKQLSHSSINGTASLIGFCGGVLSGLIGSGADMLVFAFAALLLGIPLRMAIATSVLVMATTSLVATAYHFVVLSGENQRLLELLLSAIPVVSIGAPLGALLCYLIPHRLLLLLILSLIMTEVLTTVDFLLQ
ncbi:sulfite exporter TauE/SafE family protein [Paraferrimonas sp. SM1919]|uniref:sulfite exporter TauE/SafE family protein n=1 Tax=Paraferrimonas sp. SM1919 TaxID=2662263 RepID=UPI0013D38B26|nr:sulfite exporter TauE/SafE family protein [Paraferrimonas sp. SM1919]